jgi:hypothetical protein
MTPRPLAESLADILSAAHGGAGVWDAVRVTRIELDLPVELRLGRRNGPHTVLYGELPRWRWQTGEEAPFGRLRITYTESGA